jgi:hypothetical protein
MSHERETPNHDPFWTDDQQLPTELRLREQRYRVRMSVHRAEEAYSRGHGQSEILPVATEPGARDYFLIHPYILLPDIILTVGLYDPARRDAGEAIGEVVGSERHGMRHQQIGDAQAWYYRPDQTLIFWELNVFNLFLSASDQTEDPFYAALWRDLEGYLLAQVPDVQRLATPSWEPGVDQAQWQAFLQNLGYQPAAPRAFVKPLAPRSPSPTTRWRRSRPNRLSWRVLGPHNGYPCPRLRLRVHAAPINSKRADQQRRAPNSPLDR